MAWATWVIVVCGIIGWIISMPGVAHTLYLISSLVQKASKPPQGVSAADAPLWSQMGGPHTWRQAEVGEQVLHHLRPGSTVRPEVQAPPSPLTDMHMTGIGRGLLSVLSVICAILGFRIWSSRRGHDGQGWAMLALRDPYKPPKPKAPIWIFKRIEKEKILKERPPPIFWPSNRTPKPVMPAFGPEPELEMPPYNPELVQWISQIMGPELAKDVVEKYPPIMALSPASLELRLKILMRIFGKTEAFDAVSRYPAVLDRSHLSLQRSFDVLKDLFGQDQALSFAFRDPGLLITRRMTIVAARRELQTMLGWELGQKTYQEQPILLREEVTNLRATLETLIEALGDLDNARRAILRWPFLMATTENNIRDSAETLAQILGADKVQTAARAWPPLLVAPPDNMWEVYRALQSTIGEAAAANAVAQVPSILARTAEDISGAIEVLEQFLDPRKAVDVMRRVPLLAATDSEQIGNTLTTLSDVLGQGQGHSAVERWPKFLSIPAPALRDSVTTLAGILGPDLAVQAVVSLGDCLSADKLRASFEALALELGHAMAAAALRRDPGILGLDITTVRTTLEAVVAPVGQQLAVRLLGARPELLRAAPPLLEANLQSLVEILGPEGAVLAAEKTPELLRRPIAKAAAALTQGLELQGAARVVCHRPELLYDPNGPVWKALDAIIYAAGQKEAIRMVEQNSPLLDIEMSRGTLAGVVQALAPYFGRIGAARLVEKFPGLLDISPEPLGETAKGLVEEFGFERARNAVVTSPALLATPVSTLRRILQAWSTVFQTNELDVLLSQYSAVLSQRAADPQGSLQALVDSLGPAGAQQALALDPALVTVPSDVIYDAIQGLQAVLGEQGAPAAVACDPILLKRPGRAVGNCLNAMAETLGQQTALRIVELHAGILASSPQRLRATLNGLVSALGRENAASAALQDPTLLQVALAPGALEGLLFAVGMDNTLELLRDHQKLPLGTRPVNPTKVLEGIADTFGGALALQVALRHPKLMWAMPTQPRSTAITLINALGPTAAVTVVEAEPQYLSLSEAVMSDLVQMLVGLLGEEGAQKVLVGCRALATTSLDTVRATLQVMQECLTREGAASLLLRDPAILTCITAPQARATIDELELVCGGRANALQALLADPRVLTASSNTIRDTAAALRERLTNEAAEALILKQPSILRHPPDQLVDRIQEMIQ